MNRYLIVIECSANNFLCSADDTAHALEQARDAYPDAVKLTPYLLVSPDTHGALVAALRETAERLAYFYEEGSEHPAIKRADAALAMVQS